MVWNGLYIDRFTVGSHTCHNQAVVASCCHLSKISLLFWLVLPPHFHGKVGPTLCITQKAKTYLFFFFSFLFFSFSVFSFNFSHIKIPKKKTKNEKRITTSQLDTLKWLIRSPINKASSLRRNSTALSHASSSSFTSYSLSLSLSRIYYSLLIFSSGYHLNLQKRVSFAIFGLGSLWLLAQLLNSDLGFQWTEYWGVSDFGVCAWIGAENATGLVVRPRPRRFRHRVHWGWSLWSIWSGQLIPLLHSKFQFLFFGLIYVAFYNRSVFSICSNIFAWKISQCFISLWLMAF